MAVWQVNLGQRKHGSTVTKDNDLEMQRPKPKEAQLGKKRGQYKYKSTGSGQHRALNAVYSLSSVRIQGWRGPGCGG